MDVKPMRIADLYGEPEEIPEHILLREQELQKTKKKTRLGNVDVY